MKHCCWEGRRGTVFPSLTRRFALFTCARCSPLWEPLTASSPPDEAAGDVEAEGGVEPPALDYESWAPTGNPAMDRRVIDVQCTA